MKVFWFLVVGVWAAGTVWAFPPGYNPFPEDARPEPVELQNIYAGKMLRIVEEPDQSAVFRDEGDGQERVVRLWIAGDNELQMSLEIAGEKRINGLPLGDTGWALHRIYGADLNRDGVEDYVVQSWSGGCGRAASRTPMCFVLSNGDGYTANETVTYYGRSENFVLLDGKPCFVNVMDADGGPSQDGFAHSYYVQNILTFDKDRVRVANELHPGFPRIQWDQNEIHTDPRAFEWKEPLGSETTLLTDGQKQNLFEYAAKEIGLTQVVER